MPGDGDAIKPARALRAFPRSAKVRPLRAGGDLAHDRFSKGCSMTYRKVRGSSARFAARFAGGVMASVLVASAAMAAPAPKVPPVDQALMREVVKTLASDAGRARPQHRRRAQGARCDHRALQAGRPATRQQGRLAAGRAHVVEVTASNVSPLVVSAARSR
jgi:hypothetical protein